MHDSGAYSFFGRTGFVAGVADLKGKRMRFQKGDTSAAMFRRLGVGPAIAPSRRSIPVVVRDKAQIAWLRRLANEAAQPEAGPGMERR